MFGQRKQRFYGVQNKDIATQTAFWFDKKLQSHNGNPFLLLL
jgi:hypothetical protein